MRVKIKTQAKYGQFLTVLLMDTILPQCSSHRKWIKCIVNLFYKKVLHKKTLGKQKKSIKSSSCLKFHLQSQFKMYFVVVTAKNSVMVSSTCCIKIRMKHGFRIKFS